MLHFRSPDIGLFGRRQRYARGHRVPVSIVNGPVGTTDSDTAVVVDNFNADEVSLGSGCACCTVRENLQTELRRLLAERERRHFARVVIETSNDPGAILRTLATERVLGAEFYVEDAPPLVGTRFELTELAPLSWDAFSRFMATLTALRGADLLHVKGMLNVTGCRGPVVVQFVQHLAHTSVELQAWPGEDRASRVTFVTRNIDEKTVRDLFDAVRSLTRVPDAVQRAAVHR
jgi:G3E family GTPase